MSALHHVTAPMPEPERNERVYTGEILVFRGFQAVTDLVQLLRAHCRALLGSDPETAHHRMAEDELNEAASALRNTVRQDSEVAKRLNTAFEAVGVDLHATFGDGLKQRVQVAGSRSERRMLRPLAPHRDSWGTNIPCQTNWWAPLYTTTPQRTLALFPSHFARAVPNNSEGWDFRELLRKMKEQGPEPDYPLLPLAQETPPEAEALPISLLPGDLLCFSSAHLHGSVPNQTDRTRLSFEVRTVNAHDVAAGRGAPNVDGRALRTPYQLFKRLTDGEKLGRMT
jgi:hypothetical protein